MAPIDLMSVDQATVRVLLDGINWVIIGGECCTKFRPMEKRWAREILAACRATGAAFCYKQSSGIRSEMDPYLDGVAYMEMPTIDARIPASYLKNARGTGTHAPLIEDFR